MCLRVYACVDALRVSLRLSRCGNDSLYLVYVGLSVSVSVCVYVHVNL